MLKTSTDKASTMQSYNDGKQNYIFLNHAFLYMEPMKVYMPSSILEWLHHVGTGNVAKDSKVDAASTSMVEGCWHTQTLNMEAGSISETTATLPTSTQYNYPRTELTSTVKHCESLKSIVGGVIMHPLHNMQENNAYRNSYSCPSIHRSECFNLRTAGWIMMKSDMNTKHVLFNFVQPVVAIWHKHESVR
jgi:hypothetical protein